MNKKHNEIIAECNNLIEDGEYYIKLWNEFLENVEEVPPRQKHVTLIDKHYKGIIERADNLLIKLKEKK